MANCIINLFRLKEIKLSIKNNNSKLYSDEIWLLLEKMLVMDPTTRISSTDAHLTVTIAKYKDNI
jgi:hypothetical protein